MTAIEPIRVSHGARRLLPGLRSLLPLTVMSLAVSGVTSAYAQERSISALEEIVVTATRREEGLQAIPTSISAVTGADLAEKGITDFAQLTDTMPGIELSRSGSATTAGLYVRGVGTYGQSPASQSVGVLVDGVYQLRHGAVFTELMDIERVEVLRGPQGTLFGRNTTAGVIRIITADPDTQEFSGKVQAVAGNLDARELRGLVNIPLIEGRLAARISGYTAERDGYTKNVFLNRDTRNVDREGYRVKLLWDATDNFQVKLGYEDTKNASRNDLGRVAYSEALLTQYPELADYPVSLGRSQENYGFVSEDVERFTLNLNWTLGNHTLSTISAWDEFDIFQIDDRDRSPLEIPPMPRLHNAGNTKSETHEIQLSSAFEGPFNYVLGYYFQNEQLESVTDIFGPEPDAALVSHSVTLRDMDTEAWFGTLFYDFSDKWRASLGVRYTSDEREGANSQFSGVTSFNEWTYSFKLSNQVTPDVMVYFSHDKGFKSGGVNREFSAFCGRVPGGRCLTPEEALWDPETSYNWEIGVKSEWLDNTLRLNGAIFYQTYEDFQVTQDIQVLSNVLVLNAAEVEVMGVEADFLYLASDKLSINGAVAVNLAEYKDYENATCNPGSPGCVDGFQKLSGKQLDHAPKLSFNVGGEYRDMLPRVDNVEWFSRMDVVYKSAQNLYFEQPRSARQGAYYLLNARLGVESFAGWKVTLWADNLLDKEYLAEASEFLSGTFQIPGIGRTYGVTLDYAF